MSDRESGFDPDSVIFPSGNFIAGGFVKGDADEFEVRRPSDGRLAACERAASPNLVDRAVATARRAQRDSGWSARGAKARGEVLKRWADLIEAEAEALARIEATVSARLIAVARQRDLVMTIAMIRYYAELADKIESEVVSTADTELAFNIKEPFGVVAAIAPWNAPLLLAAGKFAPALAAGNAIVLKPSELTPFSALEAAKLAVEAGLPEGLFSVVLGFGAETGSALVRHPDISYVSFTGSTASGAAVMADAALHGLKPVSLELGGKSPQLVLDDANIERTADLVASSILGNAGQVCFAGTRLVAQRKIVEPLVERIQTQMSAAKPGPTWDPQTSLSPISSSRQLSKISDILARAARSGGEIITGGKCFDVNEGHFFEPTIVKCDDPENPAVSEEIFGPVLTVQTFDDFEEGLQLADHPSYGLASGVHTQNLDWALRAARSIEAGTVWINNYGLRHVEEPMGGYKKSGFGKDFGPDALRKYTRSKHVRIKIHR